MDSAEAAPASSPKRYLINDIVLDTGRRRASRQGTYLPLSRLSFDLLLLLAERAPDVVSRSEFAEKVWGPRRVVTQETLSQSLARLRHALGDTASDRRYIESVRGHGYRLIPTVQSLPRALGETEEASPPPAQVLESRAFGFKAVVAGAALVLVGILILWYRATTAGTSLPGQIAQTAGEGGRLPNSIAVMPFEAPDAESGDTEFAGAVHAGVLNELGQLRALNVIARASVLHYGATTLPIAAVADELNVRMILKGEIHYFGDERQVIAELVSGNSGVQLWTKRYPAATPNALSIQRDIAADVATELSFIFGMEDDLRILGPPTTSDEAWAFFQRADQQLNEDTIRHAPVSQILLDRAIRLDPEFSYAYALKALIYAYMLEGPPGIEDDPAAFLAEQQRLLHENVGKALELNPDNDIAYWALGIESMLSWNWTAARGYFEKTLEISPNHSSFLAQFGWFRVCALGEREGLEHIRRAAELDPRNPFVPELEGRSLGCLGDQAGAYAAMRRAVDLEPIAFRRRAFRARYAPGAVDRESALQELRAMEPLGDARRWVMSYFAHSYAALGEQDDARRLGERMLSLSEADRFDPSLLVYAHLALGDREAALEELERAVENRGLGSYFWPLLDIKVNRGPYVPVLDEPDFAALRERLRSLD